MSVEEPKPSASPPTPSPTVGDADGSRLRRILTLALPIVGGMVSQNLLNLVDTFMVGRL
ncbi:MAG: hypothetical protein R3B07_31090 [Polyangiaceae bacterium]